MAQPNETLQQVRRVHCFALWILSHLDVWSSPRTCGWTEERRAFNEARGRFISHARGAFKAASEPSGDRIPVMTETHGLRRELLASSTHPHHPFTSPLWDQWTSSPISPLLPKACVPCCFQGASETELGSALLRRAADGEP